MNIQASWEPLFVWWKAHRFIVLAVRPGVSGWMGEPYTSWYNCTVGPVPH